MLCLFLVADGVLSEMKNAMSSSCLDPLKNNEVHFGLSEVQMQLIGVAIEQIGHQLCYSLFSTSVIFSLNWLTYVC